MSGVCIVTSVGYLLYSEAVSVRLLNTRDSPLPDVDTKQAILVPCGNYAGKKVQL